MGSVHSYAREAGKETGSERRQWSAWAAEGLENDDEPLVDVVRPWYEDEPQAVTRPTSVQPAWSRSHDAAPDAEAAFSATAYQRGQKQIGRGMAPLSGRLTRYLPLLLAAVVLVAALFFVAHNVAAAGVTPKRSTLSIPPASARALAPGVVQPLQVSIASVPQSNAAPDAPAPPANAAPDAPAQPAGPTSTYYVTTKEVVPREHPALDANPSGDWAARTLLETTGVWSSGPEGITWWEVIDMSGNKGWAPAMDLHQVP